MFEACDYMTKVSSIYLIQQECLGSDVLMTFDSESFMEMLASAGERGDPMEAPFSF